MKIAIAFGIICLIGVAAVSFLGSAPSAPSIPQFLTQATLEPDTDCGVWLLTHVKWTSPQAQPLVKAIEINRHARDMILILRLCSPLASVPTTKKCSTLSMVFSTGLPRRGFANEALCHFPLCARLLSPARFRTAHTREQ